MTKWICQGCGHSNIESEEEGRVAMIEWCKRCKWQRVSPSSDYLDNRMADYKQWKEECKMVAKVFRDCSDAN